jgi:hypothetical protein
VYNKSGIEIMQTGMQWVQETVLQGVPIAVNHMDGSREKSASSLKYKIQLQPVFEIANIRENSLAAKVVC